MAERNEYLYLRTNYDLKRNGVCRLGKTINLHLNDKSVTCGERTPGSYILVLETEPGEANAMKKFVINNLSDYNDYRRGGKCFYRTDIKDKIEPLLKQNDFIFKKLTDEEVISRVTLLNNETVEFQRDIHNSTNGRNKRRNDDSMGRSANRNLPYNISLEDDIPQHNRKRRKATNGVVYIDISDEYSDDGSNDSAEEDNDYHPDDNYRPDDNLNDEVNVSSNDEESSNSDDSSSAEKSSISNDSSDEHESSEGVSVNTDDILDEDLDNILNHIENS